MTFGESFGDVDAEDDSHHATIIDVSGHIIDIYRHDGDSNDDGQCDLSIILIMVAFMT